MSNDLDIYKEYTPPQASGGLFLKLEDGETVKVRLVSLPIVFQNSFKAGDETTLSTRYAWVVFNIDQNCAQIWQTNAATYGQVSDLVKDEDYGDHREYDVKITRNGEGPKTRYSVRPGVKRYALDDKAKAACDAIDPIAVIDKSANTSSVMWLADYHKAKEAADRRKRGLEDEEGNDTPGYAAAKAKADELKAQKEADSLVDEPINMDDIPF